MTGLAKFLTMTLAGLVGASSLALGDSRWQWPSERFDPAPVQRNIAGQFDYYALVLSWSPTHCAESRSDYDDLQCNRHDGRRYAFVLHGLWPQYEKGYPEACRMARRPFVPQSVIDGMLDIMPAPGLVIHEYKKHGTCSGLDPNSYFALARRLAQSIRIPDRYRNPFETQFIAPQELAADFARANPQLKPQSFAVSCGGPGNRLREIHLCFTKEGQSRACSDNEDQARMCSAERMFVPPVRSTARDGTENAGRPQPQQKPAGNGQGPLPGPRDYEEPDDNN